MAKVAPSYNYKSLKLKIYSLETPNSSLHFTLSPAKGLISRTRKPIGFYICVGEGHMRKP